MFEDALNFKGRASRLDFLYYSFGVPIILFAILYLVSDFAGNPTVTGALTSAVGLGAGLTSIAAHVRRLHDMGKTGWLVLINLIPGANVLFFGYLALIPGFEGENSYGKPKPPALIKQKFGAVAMAFLAVFANGVVTGYQRAKARNEARHQMDNGQGNQGVAQQQRQKNQSVSLGSNKPKPPVTELERTPKWSAEQLFSISGRNLVRRELVRFQSTCQRVPTSAEGLSALGTTSRISDCPSWSGVLTAFNKGNLTYPVYYNPSGATAVVYTYGADNQPGGDGPNKDRRMDIQISN